MEKKEKSDKKHGQTKLPSWNEKSYSDCPKNCEPNNNGDELFGFPLKVKSQDGQETEYCKKHDRE